MPAMAFATLLSRAKSSLSSSSRRLFSTATPPSPPPPRLQRYSYIVAPDQLLPGMKVLNSTTAAAAVTPSSSFKHGMLDPLSQVGNSMPLSLMRIGTFVHCVEHRPGQGAKFVRAAGTSAKIIKISDDGQCLLRMPSGVDKLFDSRCRATIGRVSNPERKHHRLRKAGQSRWLGRRPVVRGVAMNPIDHPHGGGEGRTSGGRPSVSPWGKPTKSGYKTVLRKNHDARGADKGGKRKGRRS